MLKKTISKIMAVTMLFTSFSSFSILSAKAALELPVVWENHFKQDYQSFEAGVTPTGTTNEIYTKNASEVKEDGTNKYLLITPKKVTANQADGIGGDSKWAVALKEFDATKTAKYDLLKLSYRAKFTTTEKQGTGTTSFGEYSALQTKVYQTGRSWATRITPVKHQLLDAGSAGNPNFSDASDWFDVSYVLDGTNLTATIAQNGKTIATHTKTNATGFIGYLFGCDAGGYGICIDDISVDYGTVNIVKEIVDGDIEIDFEKYNSISDVPTDTNGTFYLTGAGTADASIETIDNNKVLKLHTNDSSNYRYFQVDFNQEVTKTQKVIIEYDMMSQNDPKTDPKLQLKTEIHFNEKGYETAAMIQDGWKASHFTGGGTAEGTQPESNTWYHVKHEVDIKNKKATTIFTNKTTEKDIFKQLNVTGNMEQYEYLKSIGFHSSASAGRTSYFDNIKIDYVYDVPNPEISVYAGDALQEDLNAVSADTDSIKVNFNAKMDEATVTDENIYVVNKLTNEAVASSVSYADGVATLALENGVHKGASYKVVVTDGAKNPEGIGTAKEVEFTVENNSVNEDVLAQDLSIDFEDFDSIDDVPTDANNTFYLQTVGGAAATSVAAIKEFADGNKALKLNTVNSTDYRYFWVKFDQEATKKSVVTIEYDMMSEDATPKLKSEFYYNENGFTTAAQIATDWVNSVLTGNGINPQGKHPKTATWYHVKHVLDTVNNTAYTVFTDTSTGDNIYEKSVTNFTAYNYFRSIGFNCKTGMDGKSMYVDNITVSYKYDAPEVSADSVKLYADDAIQADKTQVSQLTNKLTVNFGTAMDVATLTTDSVYVTNKATGAKLAATLDYENGVATLNFAEKLAKNVTYVLNIENTVMSAQDVAIADYTPVEFTVENVVSLPTENVGKDIVIDFEEFDLSDIPELNGDAAKSEAPIWLRTTYDGTGEKALAEVVTIDDNNVLKLQRVASKNYRQFMVNIDDDASKEAKVIIKYDVRSDDETNRVLRTELWYTGGTTWSVLGFMQPSWKSLNNSAASGAGSTEVPKIGEWYHVEHELDIKNNKYSAVIKNKANGNVILTANSYKDTIESISQVGFGSRDISATTGYYDNIEISYVYDVPTVTTDSVSIINTEGAVQNNWNNISLLTKEVKVDFGAVMDTNTLTAENVYLENKATGDKVDAVFSYADGVLTMSLTEKLLAESVYKLVITDEVTNVDGAKVADYTPLEFTTGESKRTAVLTGLYKGSQKVTKLADLKAGDTLAVKVSYANSTSDDQTVNVLIAYYAGDALDHIELVKTENISASIATMNYTYNHTVSDLTDITRVKVFSWDAFANMVPLSESIALN